MLNLGQQLAVCHTLALQFIGYDHARHILKALKQTSEEPFGCSGIPSWRNEDVEHDTVLEEVLLHRRARKIEPLPIHVEHVTPVGIGFVRCRK